MAASGENYMAAVNDDHDRMLSSWGIHHLHLSNAPGRGGFNERGSGLLYAIFRPDDAYLVGVYTHNDWARRELVEVIVRNWPDAGLFLKSTTTIGLGATITDQGRSNLRRSNVNEVLIEVDGGFYGPPALGLTGDGGSFRAARRSMEYMEHLGHLRETLNDHLDAFGRELDEAAGYPVKGECVPRVNDGHVGLGRGDAAFIGIGWLNVD
jgi:hypothetical protein